MCHIHSVWEISIVYEAVRLERLRWDSCLESDCVAKLLIRSPLFAGAIRGHLHSIWISCLLIESHSFVSPMCFSGLIIWVTRSTTNSVRIAWMCINPLWILQHSSGYGISGIIHSWVICFEKIRQILSAPYCTSFRGLFHTYKTYFAIMS